MKNIRIFHLKKFPFLVVKFSICLKRRVFVMYEPVLQCLKSLFMMTLPIFDIIRPILSR